MYTDILRGIEGVGIFPVVSLVLFVAVFTVVLVWAIRADRERMDRHAAIPLAETSPTPVSSDSELFCRRHA
jgi:hypothetical protein